MLNTICVGCGDPFMRVKQRGRPREYCTDCRPSIGRRPNYNQIAPKKGRRPDYSSNATKRSFQANTYKVLQGLIGDKKLDINRSLASLCDDQTKSNNQLGNLLNSILVDQDQYLGFCMDGQKIIGNGEFYNRANWFCADMCGPSGIYQMSKANVKIIDYDSCWSLKNQMVRGNLEALFLSDLLPTDVILMINVRVKGVRDERYVNHPEYWQLVELMEEIPGFKNWQIDWSDKYTSEQDGAVYRSVIMTRR